MVLKKAIINLTVFYAVLVLIISLLPISKTPPSIPYYDKLIHIGFYMGLNMLLLACSIKRSEQRSMMHNVLVATMVTIGYSILIEFVQPLTGRNCDLEDMVANSIGALLGAALYVAFRFTLTLKRLK